MPFPIGRAIGFGENSNFQPGTIVRVILRVGHSKTIRKKKNRFHISYLYNKYIIHVCIIVYIYPF